MQTLAQLAPLLILFVAMYFLMIRPQKKRDKQVKDMRDSLTVGDEIVTIGGICGKVVKTKDESFIIQVGADKVKFEMMRWAVSAVTKESNRRDSFDAAVEEDEPKKAMPKKLKKDKAAAVEEAVEETEN